MGHPKNAKAAADRHDESRRLAGSVDREPDAGMEVLDESALRSLIEETVTRSVLAALRDGRLIAKRPVAGAARRRAHARSSIEDPVIGEPAGADARWELLSQQEREISALVGQAMTNVQIAHRIGRSPHTVNYHLRQIFRKLGIGSRVELATLFQAQEQIQTTEPVAVREPACQPRRSGSGSSTR